MRIIRDLPCHHVDTGRKVQATAKLDGEAPITLDLKPEQRKAGNVPVTRSLSAPEARGLFKGLANRWGNGYFPFGRRGDRVDDGKSISIKAFEDPLRRRAAVGQLRAAT